MSSHVNHLSNTFLQDHFHVHVVNANYSDFKGVSAGQAHLLEDIISLVSTRAPSEQVSFVSHKVQLELSPITGPTLISQMTLTYQLGEHHALFNSMVNAQERTDEDVGTS